MIEEIVLFHDTSVKVTLTELLIKDATYPLKDVVNSQVEEKNTLQIKIYDSDSMSSTWYTVFESEAHQMVQEIHEAITDALAIRHFYTGRYLNLPHYFGVYKQIVEKRGISSLPITAYTTFEELVVYLRLHPLPLDFDA